MTHHLVLLPGLNNTRSVFDGVVMALPADVLPHAMDNPAASTVEAIAATLLPALPPRFWLAGFSFGGYVALALLQAVPERVAGIAMVCTAPFADSPAQSDKRRASLDVVAGGGYLDMVEAQAANAFHPDSLQDEALMAARRRMVRAYGANHYVAHVQATMARPDRAHLLDGTRPTAVVAASHDRVFAPQLLAGYAATIPGASFDVVDGAGHLLPMEKPEQLARLLAAWMRRAA